MIFTYLCNECPRQMVTEELAKMVICIRCMCEMELIMIGKTKVQEGMIIQ